MAICTVIERDSKLKFYESVKFYEFNWLDILFN